MRKFISATLLVFAIGLTCYSQDSSDNKHLLTYKCDGIVKQDLKSQKITLTENVNLKTSVFEFLNADQITINKATNEIYVIGSFKVNLNGGKIQKSPKSGKKKLRYKIGESIAYIE